MLGVVKNILFCFFQRGMNLPTASMMGNRLTVPGATSNTGMSHLVNVKSEPSDRDGSSPSPRPHSLSPTATYGRRPPSRDGRDMESQKRQRLEGATAASNSWR